ncbi:MAG: glycosyltransferase family 2 protein [Candidatus Omnitrophica bacterium]|nr:glycosyltransferase family 2 protein [Candidatus Omnitrophota bacterium]
MNERYSISVILPVYNEEGNIREVIGKSAIFLQTQDIFKDYEIIVVDDGSKDGTAEILKELANKDRHIKIITHYKNLGYGKALTSGLNNSIYPLVFFMDADGQFDISDINNLIPNIDSSDIIIGYRHKRNDNFYRVFLAKTYSFLVFLLFGLKLKDVNCGFKLFKRQALPEEDVNCRAGTFFTEILLKAKNKGYKIKQIPVEHFPRLKGRQSGASLKIIFNGIIDLFYLKFLLVRSII